MLKAIKKITLLTLASILLVTAQVTPLTAQTEPEETALELDIASYPLFFATEYLNALWPLSGEDIQFIREHADELREEFLFGLEQQTPEHMASMKQEIAAMLNRIEQFIALDSQKITIDINASNAKSTNLITVLNHKLTQNMLNDVLQNITALHELMLERYPETECPLINGFLVKATAVLQAAAQGGYAMLLEQGHNIMVTKTPLKFDAKQQAQLLGTFKAFKTALLQLLGAQMKFNLTHTALHAELFTAFTNVLKDDVICNEFINYMHMSDAPNPYLQALDAVAFYEQDLADKKQNMPFSLQQLLDVSIAYSKAQQEALGGAFHQFAMTIQNSLLAQQAARS